MSIDVLYPTAHAYTLENDSFEAISPQKRVRFIMFSSVLDENDNIGLVRTKEHDGTFNEYKRWFGNFVNAFFLNKISNHKNAGEIIAKLSGFDTRLSKLQFLKYCIEQIKIVLEKIEEFKAIVEEEKLQRDQEIQENERLCSHELQELKSIEELQFEKKWCNTTYDVLTVKRCTRAVSLIREPSRDMGTMKFQPSQTVNVKRFLKFAEDLEEALFMSDYVIVEDDLYI